jgi:cysteine synthase
VFGVSVIDGVAAADVLPEPAALEIRTREGIDAGPEGGAALLAVRSLMQQGLISERETVVLFNTGGNKYHS